MKVRPSVKPICEKCKVIKPQRSCNGNLETRNINKNKDNKEVFVNGIGIAGVDLPRDKRIEYALPYIYGIGLTLSREILTKTGINPDTRVRDLTEAEISNP